MQIHIIQYYVIVSITANRNQNLACETEIETRKKKQQHLSHINIGGGSSSVNTYWKWLPLDSPVYSYFLFPYVRDSLFYSMEKTNKYFICNTKNLQKYRFLVSIWMKTNSSHIDTSAHNPKWCNIPDSLCARGVFVWVCVWIYNWKIPKRCAIFPILYLLHEMWFVSFYVRVFMCVCAQARSFFFRFVVRYQ